MFNDTPARKQISYWVSEQGRCMKVKIDFGTNKYIYTVHHKIEKIKNKRENNFNEKKHNLCQFFQSPLHYKNVL